MSATPLDRALGSPRWMVRTGVVLSALPILMMAGSAVMKFVHPPEFLDQWTNHFGYLRSSLIPIALLEITSAALSAIPRTAVLGAILSTGYLGGAIATHVRIGEPAFVAPVILGILVWAGLYLRDERIRRLIPLRQERS